MTDLPKLTSKQQAFVLRYLTNDNNASDAYRFAYDCENMTSDAINVEASRMLKNPKIAPWVKHAENSVQQVFEDEIKYSAKDCFDELAEVQERAKHSINSYQHELKAIELKGKLAKLFNDKAENNISVGVEMPTIKVSGKELEFKVGGEID